MFENLILYIIDKAVCTKSFTWHQQQNNKKLIIQKIRIINDNDFYH